ncbi:MAG: asparaginase [Bacteriovoracaceae bacterium]|nr:asparaginase [Bacteriovoracaceae bacterium]
MTDWTLDLEKERQDVIVLTTGGTIDKSYDEFEGTLENRQTMIKERILAKLRLPYTFLRVFSIMSKDSLYMTDFDRSVIAKSINAQMSKGCPIVVLHGTDTMAKTAEHCLLEVKKPKVPIVFTGAMKPMGFDDSDARQNVTEALLASKILPAGIYISFHNRIFKVPSVRKNKKLGTFESF